MTELSVAPEAPTRLPIPWVTWALCASIVVVFLAIQLQGGTAAAQRWGWQPANEIWRDKPWALVTSSLVHVDFIHLIFNLYWLWVLGRVVERLLGPGRLIAFAAAAALVSGAAQLAWSDQTGIGFSGVGYALFGLAWVVSVQRPDLGVRISRSTARLFGVWLLFGIFATYVQLVNFGNAAHLAGGLFGLCAGFAYTERWRSLAVTGLGAFVALSLLIAVWAPWSPGWNAAQAMSAYRKGDSARAVEWLDASLRRGQSPIWVTQTKAMIHWQAGQKQQVQADLELLRRLDAKKAASFERELEGRNR